ncbi:hypothetical protein [Roseovarius sp. MS2]|uniref:hypothetical protein n=1 Tax=Roseovarius TaxID=74030 RepID=UPI003EDC5A03
MIRITLLGVLAAILLAVQPAQAQTCMARAELLRALSERYGEVLAMQGVISTGPLLEIFIAPSGSWTIVLTRPEGVSCALMAGEGAAILTPPAGDPA